MCDLGDKILVCDFGVRSWCAICVCDLSGKNLVCDFGVRSVCAIYMCDLDVRFQYASMANGQELMGKGHHHQRKAHVINLSTHFLTLRDFEMTEMDTTYGS